MAAQPDAALHVALQRHPDALRGRRRGRPGPGRVKRIMISGPQTSATRPRRSKGSLGEELVTTPTWPVHPASATSTVTATSSARSRRQRARSSAKRSGPGAGPRRAGRPAARRPTWLGRRSRTAPRSGASPMPPATTTTSTPSRASRAPVGAERPAHADDVTHRGCAQRVGHGAHVADGVLDRAPARPARWLMEMATSPTPNAVSMLNCPA